MQRTSLYMEKIVPYLRLKFGISCARTKTRQIFHDTPKHINPKPLLQPAVPLSPNISKCSFKPQSNSVSIVGIFSSYPHTCSSMRLKSEYAVYFVGQSAQFQVIITHQAGSIHAWNVLLHACKHFSILFYTNYWNISLDSCRSPSWATKWVTNLN
jgi:hypothetical protein